MQTLIRLISVSLVLLVLPIMAAGQDLDEKWTVWVGGHYTDLQDATHKVGEFDKGENETWPEFRINYLGQGTNSLFRLDGHFFDDKNIRGKAKTTVGNSFAATFEYRSLIKNEGQDLLENFEAREWLGDRFGGKMLTHEILDPDADYSVHRQEIMSEIDVLLSEANNVRLIAAHRTTLEKGHGQSLSNDHCFSCHVTSDTAPIEQTTHRIEAGLQADISNTTVGYQIGYRQFESQAPGAFATYDPAIHPGNGGSGAEFGSRLIFSNTDALTSSVPKTEKISHKVRVKRDVGKGRFAGSAGYFKATNKNVDLTSDGWTGAAKYTVPLSPRTRLITKASGSRIWNDNPFIDLPLFRENRTGGPINFDYIRYSSLDRRTIDASAEVIHRLNPSMTLYVLAGFDQVKRFDYPTTAAEQTSDKMIGQLKMRYRKGMNFSAKAKYRFEKTSDPFTSGRGLFEARGHGLLEPLPGNTFIFYHQREDIRYQDITTVPTDRHEFDVNATYRMANTHTFNFGVKGVYDKNGDLDSLDVKHFSLKPNLSLTMTPSQTFALTAGATYNFQKSRGPVTVALFDG